MARPLLTIVPLMLSATAAASPPVPATRVTGNVSTEHHTRRPKIDACRVTGTSTFRNTKGPTSCTLTAAEDLRFYVPGGAYDSEGDACTATGVWAEEDGERFCALTSRYDDAPVMVPAVFAADEPQS